MKIIAEIKTKSPFGFVSLKSVDQQFELCEKYGDIISVHTNPNWGGSLQLVEEIRRRTKKPILAKGIHSELKQITQAIDVGQIMYYLLDGFQKKRFIEKKSFMKY